MAVFVSNLVMPEAAMLAAGSVRAVSTTHLTTKPTTA